MTCMHEALKDSRLHACSALSSTMPAPRYANDSHARGVATLESSRLPACSEHMWTLLVDSKVTHMHEETLARNYRHTLDDLRA